VSDAARLAHPKWLDPDIPRQLNTQTDGGVALIGGAFVECHLRRLLKARMRGLPAQTEDELFEGLGPLASQTGRIEIAFTFNLIGAQVRNDLLQINEIRSSPTCPARTGHSTLPTSLGMSTRSRSPAPRPRSSARSSPTTVASSS
jgi:hypothetical protein